MNKNVESKFRVMRQVRATLKKNKSKIKHLPILVNCSAKLNLQIQTVTEIVAKLQVIPVHVAANKRVKRLRLASISGKVSHLLKVYAKTTENENLLSSLVTSHNKLERTMRNQQVLDYTKGIYQKVTALGDLMLEYGLTPEMREELEMAINDYDVVITEPRKAVSERKALNDMLLSEVKECFEMMEGKVDSLMELFIDDKEFYLEYKSARMIVDAPTRHRKVDVSKNEKV